MNLSELTTKVRKKKGLIFLVSLIGIIIGVLMTLLAAYILMFLLYHSGMLVDRDNDESTLTDRMRDEYYRQGIRSVFYFVPTWQCNFNCPYCIQHNTIHNQTDDQGTTMSLSMTEKVLCRAVVSAR